MNKKLCNVWWVFLAVIIGLFVLFAIVTADPTLNVNGQGVNLVQNPSFNDDGVRSFDHWQVTGCYSLVSPPKESAAKAGPVNFDGLCSPGDIGTMTQVITVPQSANTLSFQYREILRGDQRIVIEFTDGNGWTWIARDTSAQNPSFAPTPLVTSPALPENASIITMTVTSYYCPNLVGNCGIGTKGTLFSVYTD